VAAVKALDDLSDSVCRVADAAELCRVTAADPRWRRAASEAASRLVFHVGGLNAHAGMASALAAAMAQEKRESRKSSKFSREASRVGGALLRDFARSGMFLPSLSARKAAAESETIAAVASMRFTDALADPEAGGVRFNVSYASSPVAATPAAVAGALRFEPSAGLRRKCYEAAFSRETTQHLIRPLHAMLEARSARAEVLGLGEKGWRGMLIDDDDDDDDDDDEGNENEKTRNQRGLASLAGDASTVRSFLLDLAEQLRPAAEQQVALLSRAKKRQQGGESGDDEALQPWDALYFSTRVRAEAAAAAAAEASGGLLSSTSAAPPTPSIPVEDAVGGMLDVLEAAVGVRLVRVPLREGEAWAAGVAKFAAVESFDKKDKNSTSAFNDLTSLDQSFDPSRVLGDVYLDLAPRPAKFPGAAHFTLRCGRDFFNNGGKGHSSPPSAAAAARPAVAIVASFSGLRERSKQHGSSSSSSNSSSLPWMGSMALGETTTLLHEGGHALHSLLSRTEFQHLSGTRGPLDVVELPSHVAERWGRLSVGGGVGGGGGGGGAAAAAAALATRGRISKIDLVTAEAGRNATGALDFLGQVTDALVDAELHRGEKKRGKRFSAEAAARDAAELVAVLSPLPHPETPPFPNSDSRPPNLSSFNPHARFGHLAGYGGAYYSYVYAECVAADVCARSAGRRGGGSGSGSGSGSGRGTGGSGSSFAAVNADGDEKETELTLRALRSAGEALRESLLRHGCSAPPREAVRELLARSSGGETGGGGGEEKQGARKRKEKEKEDGGGGRKGWSPDPRARLAEAGVFVKC